MGSAERCSYIREQLKHGDKYQKLSYGEKLVLLVLADSPATKEYLIEECLLLQDDAESILSGLLVKGLISYVDGKDYVLQIRYFG